MSKQKIPWLRVSIEGVVIVGSILLAFGIDAWWGGRQQRLLEVQYAERLKADLVSDTLRFTEIDAVFGVKVDVLRAFLDAGSRPLSVSDADQLMARLGLSTYNALPETRSATFREMESSGALGLLRDVTLRNAIAEYYARHELLAGILADPPGPYQVILVEALPGELWHSMRIDSTSVDQAALERGLRRLVSYPELEGTLNSELAYSTELMINTRRFKADAKQLVLQLDDVYPD